MGTDHVLVDYQTNITLGENSSVVRINQTDCLSTTETGQEVLVKGGRCGYGALRRWWYVFGLFLETVY